MMLLLAEVAAPSDPSGIVAVAIPTIGGLMSLGFVGWYAMHTTTKTIPELIKRSDDQLATARKEYRDSLDLCMEEFRSEVKEQRVESAERAKVSQELARNGHQAMTEVTRAVEGLKEAIKSHPIVNR